MMQPLVSLVAGVVFGLGLAVAEMTNPLKVLDFLDLAGNWDPSLAFVMGGAVLVTLVAFRFVLRRPVPLYGERFHLPTLTQLDRKLLGGDIYEPEEENPRRGFRGASRYISHSFRDCFEMEVAAMKKVRAMLVPVKTRKIEAIERPITAQKAQNIVWAVLPDMVWSLNEKKKTKASGASITTHFSGVPKIGT